MIWGLSEMQLLKVWVMDCESSKLKDECPHPCKTWRVSQKGRSLVLRLVRVCMRVKTLQLYPTL